MVSLFNRYQKNMPERIFFLFMFCFFCFASISCQNQYAAGTYNKEDFCLAQKDDLATLYVDVKDHAGVIRAAMDLQADIVRVTGCEPKVVSEKTKLGKNSVIIGTIGKSRIIDQLIKDGKIDAAQIAGK